MIEIRVIVPAYNAAPFIGQCLDSLAAQVYDGPWSVYVVNDASTDGTADALRAWAEAHPNHPMKWGYMLRKSRRGELGSIQTGTEWARQEIPDLSDETVICHVCGDDYLPHPGVLAQLAAVYVPSECRPRTLMTYGSYAFEDGKRGHVQPYPDHVHRDGDYRDRPWQASHLRSYRYGLWRRIPADQLIDPATGKPWFYATDRAMMYPMLEMARERAVYVDDVLYTYRRHDGNVPGWQDAEHCRRVAAMPRLERVEDWR